MSQKPSVVVITPARNEGDIMRRFLKCCDLFADKIIVLDQGSTDDTREICADFEKVIVRSNDSEGFDEAHRQKALLEIGRTLVKGQIFFIALDVDEILTANFIQSPEWATALQSRPGTVVRIQLVDLLPGGREGLLREYLPVGFMDDGSQHNPGFIHSFRVPIHSETRFLDLNQIKLIHYSFIRPELQAAKNRYYCVMENLAASRSLSGRRNLYRYDFIEDRISRQQSMAVTPEFFKAYEERGIDMTSQVKRSKYWFDEEVDRLLRVHGGRRFDLDPIWNRTYPKDTNISSCSVPTRVVRRFVKLIESWGKFAALRPVINRAVDAIGRLHRFFIVKHPATRN